MQELDRDGDFYLICNSNDVENHRVDDKVSVRAWWKTFLPLPIDLTKDEWEFCVEKIHILNSQHNTPTIDVVRDSDGETVQTVPFALGFYDNAWDFFSELYQQIGYEPVFEPHVEDTNVQVRVTFDNGDEHTVEGISVRLLQGEGIETFFEKVSQEISSFHHPVRRYENGVLKPVLAVGKGNVNIHAGHLIDCETAVDALSDKNIANIFSMLAAEYPGKFRASQQNGYSVNTTFFVGINMAYLMGLHRASEVYEGHGTIQVIDHGHYYEVKIAGTVNVKEECLQDDYLWMLHADLIGYNSKRLFQYGSKTSLQFNPNPSANAVKYAFIMSKKMADTLFLDTAYDKTPVLQNFSDDRVEVAFSDSFFSLKQEAAIITKEVKSTPASGFLYLKVEGPQSVFTISDGFSLILRDAEDVHVKKIPHRVPFTKADFLEELMGSGAVLPDRTVKEIALSVKTIHKTENIHVDGLEDAELVYIPLLLDDSRKRSKVYQNRHRVFFPVDSQRFSNLQLEFKDYLTGKHPKFVVGYNIVVFKFRKTKIR